jgi:hypothetical protein
MSVTEFVISFIFMAVAVLTILVVGTLGAADLLHRPNRNKRAEDGSDSSQREHGAGDARPRQAQSGVFAQRNAETVDALMPLGSSLSYVWHPKRSESLDPSTDHDDPSHGRAA